MDVEDWSCAVLTSLGNLLDCLVSLNEVFELEFGLKIISP